MCTDSMSRDLNRLLLRFGQNGTREIAASNQHNVLQRATNSTSSISEADEEYVRSCLYPVDALLYSKVCQ
jgi:hypothetical protein